MPGLGAHQGETYYYTVFWPKTRTGVPVNDGREIMSIWNKRKCGSAMCLAEMPEILHRNKLKSLTALESSRNGVGVVGFGGTNL